MRKRLVSEFMLLALMLVAHQAMAQTREMNLHQAARIGDIARVRQLLERGANANLRDQQRNTPLHVAVYHGNIAIAALLIHDGANVNASNHYHETPLFYAAAQGQRAAAELLLQKGADVNARDTSQSTPLFYAAVQGRMEVVQLLLQRGADANARNRNSETPLDWAKSHGKTDVAVLLMQQGTNVHGAEDVTVQSTASKTALPHEAGPAGQILKDPSTGVIFVLIQGGCFQMGSNDGGKDERPVHTVCVRDFYMGKYEVTQGQWKSIMGQNPSRFIKCGDSCPVENVSWNDTQEFIRRLNAKTGSAKYRLPTEAEWEYAAKAGSGSERYGEIGQIAWYDNNSRQQTHEVGQKRPNAWGLYDMLGNVWEWVQDWYGEYPPGLLKDPTGPSSGLYRVVRGGSWHSSAGDIRSSLRISRLPSGRYFAMGFRLARTN